MENDVRDVRAGNVWRLFAEAAGCVLFCLLMAVFAVLCMACSGPNWE